MSVYTYIEYTHRLLLKKIKRSLLFKCWTESSIFLFQKATNLLNDITYVEIDTWELKIKNNVQKNCVL